MNTSNKGSIVFSLIVFKQMLISLLIVVCYEMTLITICLT